MARRAGGVGRVIYQLRHPIGIVSILVALVIGVFLHDAAQTLVSQALGDQTPRRGGRLSAGLQPRVDPYGAVSAVILGFGWGSPVVMDERWRARRRKLALALAVGPLIYLILAALATGLFRAVLDQGETTQRASYLFAYTFAAMFVLSCIPTPPLDGGRIMFALAPQSVGWQKARYQLIDRGFGVAVALAVVFLPLVLPVPSIIGGLADDVLNGLGAAVGLHGLGDASAAFNVP